MAEVQLRRAAWLLVAAGTTAQLFLDVSYSYQASILLLAAGHYSTLRWKGYAPFREPGFYGMLIAFLLPVIGPAAAVSRLLTLPRQGEQPERKARLRSRLINAGLVLLVAGIVIGGASSAYLNEARLRRDNAAQSAMYQAIYTLDEYMARHKQYPDSLEQAGIAAEGLVDLEYHRTGRFGCELTASHRRGRKLYRAVSSREGWHHLWRSKQDPDGQWQQRYSP